MKHTIKTAFLILLTLLLVLFILFVDTTFYHVPSFIKIYRVEREITISIIGILILFGLQAFIRRRKYDLKKTLLSAHALIISLFVLVLLPQIIFKKFLVLWDDNPFLAEFPMIWNAVSEFCAVLTVSILFVILIFVKKLLDFRPNRFSNFEYRLLLTVIIFSSVIFNFIENRYTFERVSVFQHGSSAIIWIVGLFLLLITLVISFYKSWTDVLNKREKYIGFVLSIFLVPVGLYLLFSNLLFPVYAFSITVKGFVLSTLVFINIYSLASFIGLLFRLPTASIYDRVTREILSISQVSKMISDKASVDAVFQTIVENACSLTASDACWLAVENETSELSQIMASVHLSENERSLLSRPEACCFGNIVRKSGEAAIIYNISEDERTLPLQMLNLNWKSMIAVPLIQSNTVVGVLYSVKKPSYAYDENDLITLKSFAIQTNIVLISSPIIRSLDSNLLVKPAGNQVREFNLGNLSVIFRDSDSQVVDKFSISEDRSLMYQINHSDSQLEYRTEIKGVLKTLFTLEPDGNKAYSQAIKMITNDYPEIGLSVLSYTHSKQELSVFNPVHFQLMSIHKNNDNRDVKIGNCEIFTNDDNLQYFRSTIELQHEFIVIIGSAETIELIDGNRLKSRFKSGSRRTQSGGKESEIQCSEILKKIIPESKQDSGTLFIFNFKEKKFIGVDL